MPDTTPQRRTQFSSCDACRHSRVACDASKHVYRPDRVRWRAKCSRCSARNRECTFEWINSVKKKTAGSQDVRSHSLTTRASSLSSQDSPIETASASLGDLRSTERLSAHIKSADILLMRWSDQILHLGFETTLGLTNGRNGCPLVNDPTSNVCIPATKLFSRLDTYLDEELDLQDPDCTAEAEGRKQQKEDHTEQSLRCAIQCFTARWLPLVPQIEQLTPSEVEETIRASWRTARKDMLKVINRASYRSILTLYLFAQTPIPVGIPENEELNGVSGSLCMHTALLQLQKLRQRQGSYQYNVSDMSDGTSSSTPNSTFTPEFLDLESRAYWAAVMWDTSSSFILNFRTSLTSGLRGACVEPAWRLTRSFLVGSYHPETEHWRTNGFDVTDEAAAKIISAAAVSTLYIWKNIASLKEALREGVEEDSVLFAWNALLDSIEIFKTSVRPLLDKCEKCIHFMDQMIKLNWYEVSIQYYLGILVLVDALEAADRTNLLPGVAEARQNAEHESFNVFKFGLENTYAICGPREVSRSVSSVRGNVGGLEQTTSVSFVAIDPSPQYAVDSVLLLSKVINRKYGQGKIKHEIYSHLSSILVNALDQLPQSSRSVSAARESLHQSLMRNTSVNDVATMYI